jgi:hypothetical protein
MTELSQKSDVERLADDMRAKQRAIVWPDVLFAGRNFDQFLWRGDPNATIFQRIAMALFAFLFLLPAIGIAIVTWHLQNWGDRFAGIIGGLVALLWGLGIGRNVFRRREKPN